MNVHLLLVRNVHTRADLGISTALAGGGLGAKTEEVQGTVGLDGPLELTLLRPERGRVLFNHQLCVPEAKGRIRRTELVPCQPMNSSVSRAKRCATKSKARPNMRVFFLVGFVGFLIGH